MTQQVINPQPLPVQPVGPDISGLQSATATPFTAYLTAVANLDAAKSALSNAKAAVGSAQDAFNAAAAALTQARAALRAAAGDT